jgi:hypothetical protein
MVAELIAKRNRRASLRNFRPTSRHLEKASASPQSTGPEPIGVPKRQNQKRDENRKVGFFYRLDTSASFLTTSPRASSLFI